MYTNVNLAAPIDALLLLGTGFLLFVAALLLVYSMIITTPLRPGDKRSRRAQTL